MRRHATYGFGIVKIVAELRCFGVAVLRFFGFFAGEQALLPEPSAQHLHQTWVLRPALAQNIAHAIEHRLHRGEVIALLGFLGQDIGQRLVLRIELRLRQQGVGQRLYASLNRDLAFGAAFLFVGQVQIFQLLLGVSAQQFDK